MDTRSIETLPLEGGHLALDFVNTLGGLRDEAPRPVDEMLLDYEDLVIWARRQELLDERGAKALRREAGSNTRASERTLRRARELRELVYAVFRPIAEGGQPAPAQLERLRDADRDALAHARLEPAGSNMRWSWPEPRELDAPLRPVVHSAVELLTEGPLDRLKICSNCRWLFLDQSRNRSRRWCSMQECGTQIKHKQFVERRRKQRSARK